MVIPELIRILTERGIEWDEAVQIVTDTCAYTNHTILAEALEKWPVSFIRKVAPAILPVIQKLDKEIKGKYKDSELAIIDKDDRIHMARMDMHFGHSVNGVAYLHTEILKNTELHDFYKIYPEKFNNKTNGITFRRWLLHCNRPLTAFLEEKIGPAFKKDAAKLEDLLAFSEDDAVLDRLVAIKNENKHNLAVYLKETQGIMLNEHSIFDIQIKRLHEYKRQQLNALYAIHKYLEIKEGKKPERPITLIFGAKAAPAYTIAKDIIHLILCLQKLIKKDKEVSPYLQVVMVENYNVTQAEKLIPACDISEQISLASKEASGTGNMKFMLNGAVTLGTEDGANVEIHDLVGDENIYIFGEDSDTVIERYQRGDYCSKDYYEKNTDLKKAVDFIVSKKMLHIGNKTQLKRLYHELLNKDWFMTFPDYPAYVETKERAYADYENKREWAKKMLVNIAKAGFFSSDRTIAQYNKDIWNL
jgi:starch phosphorylase